MIRLQKRLTKHSGHVEHATFSADGKLCATVDTNRTCIVWETDAWQSVQELHHATFIRTIGWHPHRYTLALADGSMIHLINTTTGTLFRSVNAFSPMCLDWSLDGKWLVYGSLYGHVAVWMAHGREHAQSEHIYGSYWVSVIACLDDGCILVVSSQTAVTYDLHVVRMEHYNELVTLWSRPGSGGYCLSSPLYEKRYLLVSMNKAQRVDVWDIQQKCIVKHYSKINKYCGLCARVGKDVRYTAIVDGRDMVLYDEQDVPVLRVSEHAKRVLGIVGNPVHLDQFVSISRDGTACVWAITTDPVEQEERDIINWAWMD